MPKRILLGKVGLDGHDRGIHIIAEALRESGYEVILAPPRQTPAQIAQAAIQENADALGLSSLSGAHLAHFPQVSELLRRNGQKEILLFCGGIIPREDEPALHQAGYRRIFPPGTPMPQIVDFLNGALKE
jgi:methylmalonyl-CoA mutase C-terminal domain/subunit